MLWSVRSCIPATKSQELSVCVAYWPIFYVGLKTYYLAYELGSYMIVDVHLVRCEYSRRVLQIAWGLFVYSHLYW